MKILFHDGAANRDYDPKQLRERAMGGTEATVIRVAESLADTHEVVVAQKYRTSVYREKASYEPLRGQSADVVVVLRNPVDCKEYEKCFLWMHDYVQVDEFTEEELSALEGVEAIAVSDWHRNNLLESFKCPVHRIYNPCAVKRRGYAKKPGKLIFCSSPHKGLDKTLDVMGEIVARDNSYRLYVANPGYMSSFNYNTKHLKTLGGLTHDELMRHVEESVCMLQANDVFPETFGIVYAEAKALGTPVLTYDIGAASEVYGQCVHKGATTEQFAEQFFAGLPTLEPDPRFSLETVTGEWLGRLSAERG